MLPEPSVSEAGPSGRQAGTDSCDRQMAAEWLADWEALGARGDWAGGRVGMRVRCQSLASVTLVEWLPPEPCC